MSDRRARGRELPAFIAGHLLRFGPKPAPGYEPRRGVRLLVVFVLLELVLGPRWESLARLGVEPPVVVRLLASVALALAGVRFLAGVRLREVGLVPWRAWSAAERWYFAQVLVLANALFLAIHLAPLRAAFAAEFSWGAAAAVFGLELLWGFYQELVYRGILQTELVRRWGAVAGVLVSNLLFTFGRLHLYHLRSDRPAPEIVAVFAAVFAIGLFFGTIFHRSRNLWIVGAFHGVGNAWLNGVPRLAGRV